MIYLAKRKRLWILACKMSFFYWVAVREEKELRHLQTAAAPLRRNLPVEVFQAFDQDTSWLPFFADFMGMAN